MLRMSREHYKMIGICFITLFMSGIILGMSISGLKDNLGQSQENTLTSPHQAASACSFYQITEINDDSAGNSRGDHDHQVDAGEIIEMKLSLRNNGDENATNVNASITNYDSSENNLTFIVREQSFGTITPGEIKISSGYYIFKVNGTCPRNVNITISLNIMATGELLWNNFFNISVLGAINLTYSTYMVYSESSGDRTADNDFIIDPGENIVLDLTIKNMGTTLAYSLLGTLSSDDPFVVFNDPYGDYGSLAGYGAISTGRFGIRVLGNCPDKRSLKFNLSIIDIDETFWHLNFSLIVNETPSYNVVSLNFYSYSGDGDSYLDAGEKWYPYITIQNNGTVPGYSVRTYFSSPSPYFSFYYSSNPYYWVGTLQPGASYTCGYSSSYIFLISNSAPAGYSMQFQVRITDSLNSIGWTFNYTRVIVASIPPPPPTPGDAGYSSDAGDSTSTALDLGFNLTYYCQLSETDLVDYFKIYVSKSQQHLYVVMSDCYYCSHDVRLYNSAGSSIYPSQSSDEYEFDLNYHTGYYYIKVSSYSTSYVGSYSIKVSLSSKTPPISTNPPTNPNGPIIAVGVTIAVLVGCFAIVGIRESFNKPERRKKVRDWWVSAKKTWNALGNSGTLNYPSHSQEQKFSPNKYDKALQLALSSRSKAEGYFSTKNFRDARQEWANALMQYRQAESMAPSKLDLDRIKQNIIIIEENIVNALFSQGNSAIMNAIQLHNKEAFTDARVQYNDALQNYTQGLERVKRFSSITLEGLVPDVEKNVQVCKEKIELLGLQIRCASVDKKVTQAQENYQRNGEISAVLSSIQEIFNEYLQLRADLEPKIQSNPKYQSLFQLIQQKLANVRTLREQIEGKMDQLLGLGNRTSVTIRDLNLDEPSNENNPTPVHPLQNQNTLQIEREYEYIGGQIRFKVRFVNKTGDVLTNLKLALDIPDALKWVFHEPTQYERKGETINIPRLGINECKSISVYFDPVNCMDAFLNATLSFFDGQDHLQAIPMMPKKIAVTCPIFFTQEEVNLARAKNLHDTLQVHDHKIFPIPDSNNMLKIFEVGFEAISQHDLKIVSRDMKGDGSESEAWFYGKTKVKKQDIIIHLQATKEPSILELSVAGNDQESLTALLAELEGQIRYKLTENELLPPSGKFYDLRLSIALGFCPFCAAPIPQEKIQNYKQGIPIKCPVCATEINSY